MLYIILRRKRFLNDENYSILFISNQSAFLKSFQLYYNFMSQQLMCTRRIKLSIVSRHFILENELSRIYLPASMTKLLSISKVADVYF